MTMRTYTGLDAYDYGDSTDYEDSLLQLMDAEDMAADMESEDAAFNNDPYLNDIASQLNGDGFQPDEDPGAGDDTQAWPGPLAGPDPYPEDTGDSDTDAFLEALRGKYSGAAGAGRAPAKPKRPSATDAADAVGLALLGTSYFAADRAEREAIKRALGDADAKAFSTFGRGLRDLDGNQRSMILSQVKADVRVEDDPDYRRSQSALQADQRRAAALQRSDQRRAENLDLYDKRRSALWERQDRLQQERAAKALEKEQQDDFLKAITRAPSPSPLPRSAAAPQQPALSWAAIARVIPASTIRTLVDQWQGGSLGLGALNPITLHRLMALLPVANDSGSLLQLLHSLWLQSEGSSGRSSSAAAAKAPASRPLLRTPRLRR